MEQNKILIACEFSGVIREAFKARGWDAWSCDFLPTEIPGQHYQGNVLDIISNWDIMGGKPRRVIGHPECTYLCNSGVRWLKTEEGRMEKLQEAKEFFYTLWNLPVDEICLENPIPHKYAGLPKYSQIVQPWQFGHGETKATCLWLKGLPKLQSTNIVSGRAHRVHMEPPSPERKKNRSRTYTGIAEAMAQQWS